MNSFARLLTALFPVFIAAAVFLLAAVSAPVRSADSHDTVLVEQGTLAGVSGSGGIVSFKGIPYAAPPVGERRWTAPAPPAPWPGVRQADQFGPSCMQEVVEERKPWTYEFMSHTPVSEDCLSLNVWTPSVSSRERHPVFVWIHGGAFTEGSGAVPVYDGEGLARKGVVVVTINYRLGILGFFTHPDLTRESPGHASGNYGLLDQVAALRWIQKNIAAFGGDPKRVTVAGQSAGAASVHLLTASPLARGLIHRAVAESGSSPGGGFARRLADSEADGTRFAEAKGAHSIRELRAKSWKELTTDSPSIRFGPVVDGYFLTASPADVFAQGKQNDVPTLTGLVADEGFGLLPSNVEEFREGVKTRYGDEADAFLKLYPIQTDSEAAENARESARDAGRTSAFLWAVERARTGKSKAFLYFFDHPEPGPDRARFGAFHTSEVPYVFASLSRSDRPWDETDRHIADVMSSYWANFARSGDPNGKGLPRWPAFDPERPVVMELGEQFGPMPVASDEKMALFRRLNERQASRPPGR